MRTRAAAIGSAVFLLLAPGTAAGAVPYVLTGWDSESFPPAGRVVGALLLTVGLAAALHSFARFVSEGRGTPAPIAPPDRLVIGGAYRYVRNPMYVAVTGMIFGQALLLGQPVLFVWAAVFWGTVAAFVRFYEEPTLERQFGADYERYRGAVRAWIPRPTPFAADHGPGGASVGADRTRGGGEGQAGR
jgi:protein-S-isoprenylcysteine O-methyltransferase Ste14